MQATSFYQTNIDNTISLTLLTKTQYLSALDTFSPLESNSLTIQQFKGQLGDIGIISNAEGKIVKLYVGAGEGDCEARVIAHAVNRLPPGNYTLPQSVSHAALLMWSLAQYRFDQYKTKDISPRILTVQTQVLPFILAETNAVFLVRDLINRPANDLGPQELAEVVAHIAQENGAEFKQWVGKELLENNFPAIYAVGCAAAAAPRLLSLTWGDAKHPLVTLVGKGVCFDTGGLDIKPALGMRIMKKDMGGAAQVIGLAQWLMNRKLPIRLQVYIPAVENAISAQSYRPGDVLTMRNGLKVEIDNTDAEGRLVLADALVKACEEKPELLIDFATLTGAARVAVGTELAALFTDDDKLAQSISDAAKEAGDPIWRMPLYKGYASMLDSSIADLSNASPSQYAGAITAALFLQRFIDKNLPWVHFDIMAWNIGNKPGKPEGGEAMGMQAVGHYLFSRYN